MNWTEEEIAERNRRVFLSGVIKLAPQPNVLEALIQEEITRILSEDGWRALRTDPVSDRGRAKGFGEVGMADYLYLRYWNSADPRGPVPGYKTRCYDPQGESLWIEFKRGRGGVLSKSQRSWHTKERSRGALTLIAGEDFPSSVEGFREFYRKSGLQRNRR